MMNKLLITFQMLIFTSIIHAQTYTVYSVIGNTRIVDGKKSIPLTPRKQITTKTHLFIGSESAITILELKALLLLII